MSVFQPKGQAMKAGTFSMLALVVGLALAFFGTWRPSSEAFVGAPLRPHQVLPRALATRFAQKAAEMAEDEDDDTDKEEGKTPTLTNKKVKKAKAGKVMLDYPNDQAPPEEWFKKRVIDKHLVNMYLFDKEKKPKSFFPQQVQAGDTIRVYYLEPKVTSLATYKKGIEQIGWPKPKFKKADMAETYFDGTVMGIGGSYLYRMISMRAMVGKGAGVVGFEMTFPMHSPLVTKMQVLKRGFIGRHKNAYWLRALVGKKNVIPLDKERTELDKEYAKLRVERKDSKIPEPNYPGGIWDRYPLPWWTNTEDAIDYDEEYDPVKQYDPKQVDTRNEYERLIIGSHKKRLSRSGKYGCGKAFKERKR